MKTINLFTSIIILLFSPMLFACNNIAEIPNTISESSSISLSVEVSLSDSNSIIKDESIEVGESYSEVESEQQVDGITPSPVVQTPTPKPTNTPTQIIKPATPTPIIFSPEKDFTFAISNGSVTLTGYTGQDKSK